MNYVVSQAYSCTKYGANLVPYTMGMLGKYVETFYPTLHSDIFTMNFLTLFLISAPPPPSPPLENAALHRQFIAI